MDLLWHISQPTIENLALNAGVFPEGKGSLECGCALYSYTLLSSTHSEKILFKADFLFPVRSLRVSLGPVNSQSVFLGLIPNVTRLLLVPMPNLQRLEIMLGYWRGFRPSDINKHFLSHQSFRDMEEALYNGPLKSGLQYVIIIVPNYKSKASISSLWATILREMFPRLDKDKLFTIQTDSGKCALL